MIGLVVAAAALYLVARRERAAIAAVRTTTAEATAAKATATEATARGSHDSASRAAGRAPRWLLVGAAVIGLVAAVGTSVQVVRIGHSGAEAAWSDSVSQAPAPQPSGDGGGDADGG